MHGLVRSTALVLLVGKFSGLAFARLLRGVGAKVLLATFASQAHLFFTLLEALFIVFGHRIITGGATHSRLVVVAVLVVLGDWQPAGMALIVTAFFQRMIDADAIVENKALAAPPGFVFGYFLQILQDSAT